MSNPTVVEILKDWLKEHGYTGLYYDGGSGCGCEIDDLCPCDGEITECHAGYRVRVTQEDIEQIKEGYGIPDVDVGQWFITSNKPEVE